jgi:flagellar basal-body rod modification protein FlgD
MATTSSTGGLGPNGTNLVDRTKLTTQQDAYDNMNMESFIQLMVTEMQNQDPLNPMDNAQMLQQLSSMQSINSTKKLTTTLDAVLLGQNLSNAGSLIGKTINGLTADGEDVTGKVEQATLVGNVPYLNVGDKSIPISNVKYIMPEGSTVVDDAADSSGS